jgi:hypothetical protein
MAEKRGHGFVDGPCLPSQGQIETIRHPPDVDFTRGDGCADRDAGVGNLEAEYPIAPP